MIGVWARLAESVGRGGRAALVTVVNAQGSTPREAGARMIVEPSGGYSGTIGGGTLEWRAIALAQAALAEPVLPAFAVRSFALGPELGQCCGGRVDIAIEGFASDDIADIRRWAALEAAGPFATEGRIGGDGRLRRVTAAGAAAPGTAEWGAGLLREGFGDVRRPLLLFGAGHVGRALVLALAPLPFAVTWVDPRPGAFPDLVPSGTRCLDAPDPAAVAAIADPSAFALVMSHSHALDLAIVHAALTRELAFVGLIGSATKRARFASQLRAAGVPPSVIARLACPIGVPGIRSKVPSVIAASTVADILLRDEALRASEAPSAAESRGAAS